MTFVRYWALLAFAFALAGCASTPQSPISLSSVPVEEHPAFRSQVTGTHPLDTLGLVAYAASMQGKPYLAGGESPLRGFDCSGLVHHVFSQFNFDLPRNSTAMAEVLEPIPVAGLQAADLVFFETSGPRFSHVGIYLGDGRFVHAPSPKTGRVIISSMDNQYWNQRLTGARRPER